MALADPQNEVLNHLLTIDGVLDFRVKLRGVELFLFVFEDRVLAVFAAACFLETFRKEGDPVVVGHEDVALARNAL